MKNSLVRTVILQQEQKEGATLTVQEDCNFRAEADTEAEILDVIPGGTEVTKVADGPEGG